MLGFVYSLITLPFSVVDCNCIKMKVFNVYEIRKNVESKFAVFKIRQRRLQPTQPAGQNATVPSIFFIFALDDHVIKIHRHFICR